MSAFRGAQIYIQGQTRHRLNLLARIMPPVLRGPGAESTPMSADELADSLLNETILTKYPVLGKLETEIRALEEKAAVAIREGAK
jgi:hypothetical protein